MAKMHPPQPSKKQPARALAWKLRTSSLEFGPLPVLMGIVNVTPDSFSDGGLFFDPSAAIDHALRLAEEGAAILDIGGESTRPYADVVPVAEELRRVLPVVEAVCRQSQAIVSIDTTKPELARQAVAAGAQIINDVAGFRDPLMVQAAVETGAGICAMHMQGTPQTMQDDPHYNDVTAEVYAYLEERRQQLQADGVEAERICLDPGIGFGKTHAHSLRLLKDCSIFHALESPLLVGHSRKGFIGHVAGDKEADRLPGVIGVAAALARQGVQVLRVHDPGPVRQGLLLFEASGGLDR